MGNIKSHRDLIMWQKAKDLAVFLYKVTKEFPDAERYGLMSQIRRAGVSVPSNIAEGFRRKSPKEKMQFLRMAYGSCAEIDTQLTIAKELDYLSEQIYIQCFHRLDEIEKMIYSVIGKL